MNDRRQRRRLPATTLHKRASNTHKTRSARLTHYDLVSNILGGGRKRRVKKTLRRNLQNFPLLIQASSLDVYFLLLEGSLRCSLRQKTRVKATHTRERERDDSPVITRPSSSLPTTHLNAAGSSATSALYTHSWLLGSHS